MSKALVSVLEEPGVRPPEILHLEAGARLIDAVAANWPGGFFPAVPRYRLTRGGDTRELSDDEVVAEVLEEGDEVAVILGVAGDPATTMAVIQIGLAVAAVAFAVLGPKPKSPKADNYTPQAANLLAGQHNQVRARQRIPEIFGRVRNWPDLIIPTYSTYHRDTQTLTMVMAAGVGLYNLLSPKIGETSVEEIPGVTVKKYNPYVFPSGGAQVVRENANVGGFTLRANNEVEVIDVVVSFFVFGQAQLITSPLDIFGPIVQGGLFRVSGTASNNRTFTLYSGPHWNGTVYYIWTNEAVTVETDVSAKFQMGLRGKGTWISGAPYFPLRISTTTIEGHLAHTTLDHFGNVVTRPTPLQVGRTIEIDPDNELGLRQYAKISKIDFTTRSYGRGDNLAYETEWVAIQLADMDGGGPITLPISVGAHNILEIAVVDWIDAADSAMGIESNWSPWYVVGTEDQPIRRIITDVAAGAGMYATRASGGTRQPAWVHVECSFRQIVSGVPQAEQSVTWLFWDYVPDTLRWTKYINVASGVWESKYRRVDLAATDTDRTVVDGLALARVAGSYPVDASNWGDITVIKVTIESSQVVQQLDNRNFNVVQQRRLHVLQADGTLGRRRVGTKRMIDALIYTAKSKKAGRLANSEIDLQQCADVQVALDNDIQGSRMGYFSGSFDKALHADDQLAQIADTCRCVVYRQGLLGIVRDDMPRIGPEESPGEGMFNRRTIIPGTYKLERGYASPNDPDAIIVEWRDIKSGDQLRELQYPKGFSPVNAKKVPVKGLNSYQQALNRARIEWNKITILRKRLSLQVTAEAGLLEPLAKVRVINMLREGLYDGEVVAWDVGTLTMTLDKDVVVPANASIVLRSRGSLTIDEIGCVSGTQENQVVLLAEPINEMSPLSGRQRGNLYAMGPRDDPPLEPWTLIKVRPVSNGVVEMQLRQYASEVWYPDIDKTVYADPDQILQPAVEDSPWA